MLNPNPIGKAIGDYFFDNAPAAGTPITRVQIENLWKGAISLLYPDIETNIQILPGTLVVVGVTPGNATLPVTGLGGPAQ